jgi:uncharacterized protein YndB with AHSA1/START domain
MSTRAKDFIVRKKISIKARPEEVWDALTNPEKTKKYFFNCRVFSTWQPGSPIIFKGRIFLVKKIELKGEIVQAEPQKILQYTLANGKKDNVPQGMSVITDRLTYENGETILSVTDDVGSGEGAGKRYGRSVKGWDKVLKGLKELLEVGGQDKN